MKIKRLIYTFLTSSHIKGVALSFLSKLASKKKQQLASIYEKYYKLSFNDKSLSFDRDYDVYCRWPREGNFFWAEMASFNLLAIHMFDNPIVLDIGCANGFFGNKIYGFVHNIQYFGIDLDKEAIGQAKRSIPANRLLHGGGDFL